MGRKARQRRQSHGSAWHWKQTDCWYYTMPGTKQRVALFDDHGERIRGRDNKLAAEVALAREKLTWASESGGSPRGEWIVARVCSEYLQYCEQGFTKGTISRGHLDNSSLWLNDLCRHCGALPVAQLKKGHVQSWIDGHETWVSPATRGGVISVIMAAFNRAEELFAIPNPLKGLKKPKAEPRLASFTPDEEQMLYDNLEPSFRNFLFAAIHTGLRPFCELAKMTADDIEETPRGMMWRRRQENEPPPRLSGLRRMRRNECTSLRGTNDPIDFQHTSCALLQYARVVHLSSRPIQSSTEQPPERFQVFKHKCNCSSGLCFQCG